MSGSDISFRIEVMRSHVAVCKHPLGRRYAARLRWQRVRFALAFLMIGLALGSLITAYVNYRILLPPMPQIER